MHADTFERLTPSEGQAERIASVRTEFRKLMDSVCVLVPEGPDRTYVIRQLRTAAMWCNMAITHNPDGSPRT